MDWISFAQQQSTTVKGWITFAIAVLALTVILVLWQRPRDKLHAGTAANGPGATITRNSVTGPADVSFAGNNNGIVAGNYTGYSPTQEELAREQLAELRERHKQRLAEEKAAAARAQEEAEGKARLEAANRASALVDRLRGEYLASHDGISSGMLAGTEPIPDDWMNDRLRALGERFSYHGLPGGGSTLTPIK